jgi:hypothetical protein
MRHLRAALLAGTASLLILLPTTRASTAAVTGAIPSDFNGDGIADLAIGVPGEAVGEGSEDAGAVNVLYGRPGGLSTNGNQLWTQDSPGVPGVSEGDEEEGGDAFGFSVASGDFDGDSYADLAIGAPGEALGSLSQAGAVTILYGGSAGLTAGRSQMWTEDGLGASSSGYRNFGTLLATGDFDGDGYVDLTIGAFGFWVDSPWSMQIVYGGPSGLTAARSHRITAATDGIPAAPVNNSASGPAVTSGNLDGDAYADLAIGLPTAWVGSVENTGVVIVIYGGPSGLDGVPGQLWSQDTPGVLDNAEAYDLDESIMGDRFGAALAAGDFDGNSIDDLAVGAFGEDVNGTCRKEESEDPCQGAVNVLYGSPEGLTAAGNQFWHQDVGGVPGRSEYPDAFGWALAAADFDGDDRDDLGVGSPFEGLGSTGSGAGAVITLPGSSSGLTAAGARLWTQDTPGVPGKVEADQFGWTLAAANYGHSARSDLAIGVRLESIGRHFGAGFVNVLYGGAGGLSAADSQGWSQDSAGVRGASEAWDLLGDDLSP